MSMDSYSMWSFVTRFLFFFFLTYDSVLENHLYWTCTRTSVFFVTCACVHVYHDFSHVPLPVTLWTVAHKASLSIGFSRQEYWSDCHALFQWIFLTQGLNPRLLHCRQIINSLDHLGIPFTTIMYSMDVLYLFIHCLMDIWVVSTLQLWLMLLWT